MITKGIRPAICLQICRTILSALIARCGTKKTLSKKTLSQRRASAWDLSLSLHLKFIALGTNRRLGWRRIT